MVLIIHYYVIIFPENEGIDKTKSKGNSAFELNLYISKRNFVQFVKRLINNSILTSLGLTSQCNNRMKFKVINMPLTKNIILRNKK